MSVLKQRSVKGYGYVPDLPDHRDRWLKVAAPKSLPTSHDLLDDIAFRFPVYDQGELGSCVENASGAAFQYELRRQKLPEFTPSRLAMYYGARQIEGTIMSDAGSMVRDAMKVLAHDGAADEQLWPYLINRFAQHPPEEYYAAAAQRQCLAYERVDQDQNAIKRALVSRYPIVFGFSVFESFESAHVATTGTVPMPKASEAMLGGHAVLMGGYTKGRIKARNSWGPEWGQHGHFTMPWDYVLDPDLASDFWILKLIES